MPYTYHNFDPWRKAAENIASGMVQVNQAKIAQQRYQQQMAMEAPLRQAQTESYDAEAGLRRAQTAKAQSETEHGTFVNDQLKRIMGVVEQGTQTLPDGRVIMSPEAAKSMASALVITAKGSSDLGGGIERGFKGMNATSEADKNRANSEEMNTERINGQMARTLEEIKSKGITLSPGSVNLNAADGSVRYKNPSAAEAAATYTTETEELPATPEVKAQPAKSHWFGPDTPAVEAQPARGARKITRKIPLSDNSQNSSQIPLTTPGVSGQGGVTPAAKVRIVVQDGNRFQLNPDGSHQYLGPVQ